MNADGTEQTRLTEAEISDSVPEITPDGKYILYTSRRADTNNTNEIYRMKLDGSEKKMLTVGMYPVVCK